MYSTWSESLSPPSHHPSASCPWRAAWLVDSGSSKPCSCGKQGRCWQLIWRLEWRVKQLKRVEIPDRHLACSWSWSTDTPTRGGGQTRKGLEHHTEKLRLYPGDQWFLKCDSGTRYRSITQELNRHTNSWDHPRPTESQTAGWDPAFCFNKPPGNFYQLYWGITDRS